MPSTSLIMGKLSGRNAFRDKLESLGYLLEQAALNDAFKRFKELADKKKHVFDEDIVALVDDQMAGDAGTHLAEAPESRRRHGRPADGRNRTRRSRAKCSVAQSTGNGPVDAVFNAIRAAVPARGGAGTLPGQRRHRRHRRAGDRLRAPRRQGLVATGKASPIRTRWSLGPRLCARAQQARRAPPEGESGLK